MYSDYVKCGMENDKRLNIIHSEISKFAHSQFHGRNWVIKLGGAQNNSAPFDLNLDLIEVFL